MERGEARPAELLGGMNETERKNAPEFLYYAGDPGLLKHGKRVSVVGSRNVSDEGTARTRALVKRLVDLEIVVVSGLAKGVDTVAHQTALAKGGMTIAVIGTPLDQFYPKENRALQERLMRETLVVSQFPVGHPVQPKNFPMRNRTMALLSDATIIVEAGEKSGTLHQGWEALRLGRPLFLMESVTKHPALTWPSEMMKYGAEGLTQDNLEDLIRETPTLAHAASF